MSYIRYLGIERKLLLILIAIVINGLVTEDPLLIVYILRLGARLEILGMIISTMVGFAIVASFFGGALGDIYGKKRMLQVALFLSFLGSIPLQLYQTGNKPCYSLRLRDLPRAYSCL
jgi:MFS family permease